MNTRFWLVGMGMIAVLMAGGGAFAVSTPTAPGSPVVPEDVSGKEGVKKYLLTVARQSMAAAEDFKDHADAYAALIARFDGDYQAAAEQEPEALEGLIMAMRDDYRRMDSYGYEYIEGIVAGVPELAKYDIELDAGVPAAGASPGDNVAAVTIRAGEMLIDGEGSLNNYLIEPTVFGTNPRFVAQTVQLSGSTPKTIKAPKAKLVVALADYGIDGYSRLLRDAEAWQPTSQDYFAALVAMTPTLADYFTEWKASKLHGQASGGRFVAVSRVSDMRGIMSSTRLIWKGVEEEAAAEDEALARTISRGYDRILDFIDTVRAREERAAGAAGAGADGAAEGMTIQEIDALGSQAKKLADRVAVQVSEAAALLSIDLRG